MSFENNKVKTLSVLTISPAMSFIQTMWAKGYFITACDKKTEINISFYLGTVLQFFYFVATVLAKNIARIV